MNLFCRVLFCCMLWIEISAQSVWISIDFENSTFENLISWDSSYLFTAVNSNNDPSFESQISLYKFDPKSDEDSILGLVEINSHIFQDGYYTHSMKYIEISKKWIIVQSKLLNQEERTYRVLLCNEYFETVDETYADAIGFPHTFHIDNHNEITYIIGSILGPPYNRVFYLKFDNSKLVLPSIYIGQTEPENTVYITSMRIDSITGFMLTFSHDGISIIDSSLKIIEKHHFTSILTQDYGDLLRVGDNYYSHGCRDSAWDIGFRNIVFHKYDSLFNILKADTLGKYNHDNLPFIYKSIDYRNGIFLVGGHLDGPYSNFNFSESIKKFYLAKYDKDLNLIWRKEFGGDRPYVLTGLRLLDQEEVAAYGFITDTNVNIRYAYLLYLDKDGNIITSTITDNKPKINLEIISTNFLKIVNDYNGKIFISLFDLSGKPMLTSLLNFGLNEIKTQDLPSGIYFYTIYTNKLLVKSGKWIKAN